MDRNVFQGKNLDLIVAAKVIHNTFNVDGFSEEIFLCDRFSAFIAENSGTNGNGNVARLANKRHLTVFGNALDAGGDVTNVTGGDKVTLLHAEGVQVTNLDYLKLGAGVHHSDAVSGTERTVHHADVNHNAEIAVVVGVEDQTAERSILITLRAGNLLDNRLDGVLDIKANLCGNGGAVIRPQRLRRRAESLYE